MTLKAAMAVVFGSSGGIGAALADALEAQGTHIFRVSRSTEPAIDLLDEASIARAAASFAADGISPDLAIVATGLLHEDGAGPEKSVQQLDPEWMMRNYRINAIGPALIAKHFLPLMPRNRAFCFAALSARVGSISDNGLGGWHSYRASKAALNMLIRNLALEWRRKNPEAIVVGLHPGTVETALSAPFRGDQAHERVSATVAAQRLLTMIEALGPEHSGQLLSYSGDIIAP